MNTFLTSAKIDEISDEEIMLVTQQEKINLIHETLQNMMQHIRNHVAAIVPPATTPQELHDDIRAALKKCFPDFDFGKLSPRAVPDEVKIQQAIEVLGNRMPQKFENIVYRLKEGGVSEAAAHAFARKFCQNLKFENERAEELESLNVDQLA